MYDIQALYEAGSVAEAIELLTAHPDARVLAGGSDVFIKLREGELAGVKLVSIYRIDALRGVTLGPDGALCILPLTSFSHITADPLIQQHLPVLGEAVDQVGGPQIRNIGTIGGNVCNGVTSADSAATLLAHDAIMELTGPDGARQVPMREFYVKAGKTVLSHNELLTAIRIPRDRYAGFYGAYIKYSMRNAMDIATIGCSVNVRLSADRRRVEEARIAFGVAGPVPMRAPSAEAAVSGALLEPTLVERFAEGALSDVNPRTSWRATKEFRLHIIGETARRAFVSTIQKAGGVI